MSKHMYILFVELTVRIFFLESFCPLFTVLPRFYQDVWNFPGYFFHQIFRNSKIFLKLKKEWGEGSIHENEPCLFVECELQRKCIVLLGGDGKQSCNHLSWSVSPLRVRSIIPLEAWMFLVKNLPTSDNPKERKIITSLCLVEDLERCQQKTPAKLDFFFHASKKKGLLPSKKLLLHMQN